MCKVFILGYGIKKIGKRFIIIENRGLKYFFNNN